MRNVKHFPKFIKKYVHEYLKVLNEKDADDSYNEEDFEDEEGDPEEYEDKKKPNRYKTPDEMDADEYKEYISWFNGRSL